MATLGPHIGKRYYNRLLQSHSPLNRPFKRVVITGLGTVNPIGANVDQTWDNTLAGVSGIKNIEHIEGLKGFKCKVGGELHKDYNESEHVTSFNNARIFTLAHAAFKQALNDSGYKISTDAESFRSGIIIGNQFGANENIHNSEEDKTRLLKSMNHMVAALLAIDYNFQGTTSSASIASASGAVAIGEAFRKIKSGHADFIIAGGADYNLNKHFFGGMESFRATCLDYNDTPESSCRPFDVTRAGPVLSDGAGLLALEEYEHARDRGAKIYAEIVGYGHTTDAYHILRPNENGFGIWRAATLACEEAGIHSYQIDHVNSHAASTVLGDKAEAIALKNLICTERINRSTVTEGVPEKFREKLAKVSVFAPKGHIGHTFCAAGGVETVLGIKCMEKETVPMTLNLHDPLPECDGINYVTKKPFHQAIKYMLKTSVAFGGHNNALLFKKH